ncbi:hypothetical protein E4U36_007937 [Claviceps purpurea]|nr:hypothetical protein E4U36_007937 [Claviceps purpurea]
MKKQNNSEDEAAKQRHPLVVRMIDEMKAADPKVAKFPYIEFRGAPHESPKTDDPYHASAVLRKESVGMGTGVTLNLTSTERRDGLNCRDTFV